MAATEDAYLELEARFENCTECGLHRTRNHLVFGEGSIRKGTIMVIGKAPGALEDETGLPHVGDAGRLLDELLLFQGQRAFFDDIVDTYNNGDPLDYDELRRRLIEHERIYYTNLLCCRTKDDRDPIRQELSACWDRLWNTIYLIDPIVIITLGKVPMEKLLGKSFNITTDRGRLLEMTMDGKYTPIRYPVFSLMPPAFILREGDHEAEGSWAQKTDDDLSTLFHFVDMVRLELYGEPIPERE